MLTVAHLVASFDAALAVQVQLGQTSPLTLKWYRDQLRKLTAAAGSFPANELRAYHLVSVALTNHFVRALKRLYAWALEEQLVAANGFRTLKAPPTGQRQRVLTPAEVLALYRCGTRPFARFLFVQLHTIARPGELRMLRWRDVDLANRVLRLTKFKARDKRRDGVRVRLIPLDVPTTAWFGRELRRRRRRPIGPDDFVFRPPRAESWTDNGLRLAMQAARRRAGLSADGAGERVVCYSFRHTGATDAVRDGVRADELADIMGHTKVDMTRRYLHRKPADLVSIVDRRRKGGAA